MVAVVKPTNIDTKAAHTAKVRKTIFNARFVFINSSDLCFLRQLRFRLPWRTHNIRAKPNLDDYVVEIMRGGIADRCRQDERIKVAASPAHHIPRPPPSTRLALARTNFSSHPRAISDRTV